MKNYLNFSIHEKINFKAYFLSPCYKFRSMLEEARFNPQAWQKSSCNKFGW